MNSSPQIKLVSLARALTQGPPPAGNLAVPIFTHGSLVVEIYTPRGHDPQKPHTRDEIYFVARRHGKFFDGAKRNTVEAGSFIFVPAGQPFALKISPMTSRYGLPSMHRKAASRRRNDVKGSHRLCAR